MDLEKYGVRGGKGFICLKTLSIGRVLRTR